MPLSEKARVEVYVPDLPDRTYRDLLGTLQTLFTYRFGGCTLQTGLRGYYLSQSGTVIPDPVSLIYTDTFYSFADNFSLLSDFADVLREWAAEALEEEAILVTVLPVYHSE